MKQFISYIANQFETFKVTHPRVHVIPNNVSASFCADALSAIGAKPIMAIAPEEVSEITLSSKSVVLNMGQLTKHKLLALQTSAQAAMLNNIPVVFDPVGVGASSFRLDSAKTILSIPWSGILRLNASEYTALSLDKLTKTGVDTYNYIKPFNKVFNPFLPKNLSYLITGEKDRIFNTTQEMLVCHRYNKAIDIVGTGCVLAALCGAFLASPLSSFDAALTASLVMSIACEKVGDTAGYGDYKNALLNELSLISTKDIIAYAPGLLIY